MPIQKINTSTVLKDWLDTINDVIDSTGDIYRFTQKIDTDMVDPNNSESFEDAIERFLVEHGEVTFKRNDVAIVTIVDIADTSKEYEQAAYTYNGSEWVACTGLVDADKVILRSDITLAGNYTQVGNLTKTKTGTANFATKGKSVSNALMEILSKRLQPSITTQPSVSSFSLTGAGAVEAGTTFASMSYSAGTFEDGAYTYESTTGAKVTKWEVKRVTDKATTSIYTVEGDTLEAGTDNNGGNGFVIGDSGGDNTFSSVKYTAYATYSDGNLAKDNLGGVCTNETKIAGGTKSKNTSAYTPYRNYFYGVTSDTNTIDSAYIRNLTKSNAEYAATSSLKITTENGTKRIIIACLSTKTGVTKVSEPVMGADVSGSFDKKSISVEGAEGYTAKTYNVWVWQPSLPWTEELTYTVTLG